MALYLVATPIGNLADITRRAEETLARADVVVCEDTRRTLKLMSHLGLSKPLVSLPAFDEENRIGPVLARLARGEEVALVTDAGTPGVSDPGTALVRAAIAAGVKIVPIPGPSAALAALTASGLPTDRFYVAGFLPRKGASRDAALDEMRVLGATLVIYESPHRVGATLAELRVALGDRQACVARELTKIHEELARGTLSELALAYAGDVKGECTIVVEGAHEGEQHSALPPPAVIEEEVRRRLAAGESARDIAHSLAARGMPRRAAHAMTARLKGE